MKDFKNINFEILDLNMNATPDMYLNKTGITFSKKIIEDLNYPANVQYCISPENRVFAIRVCKSNESKPVAFSKPKSEQTATFNTSNKNLIESIRAIMPENYNIEQRYKIIGHFDAESRTMFFDMEEAVIDSFRQPKTK